MCHKSHEVTHDKWQNIIWSYIISATESNELDKVHRAEALHGQLHNDEVDMTRKAAERKSENNDFPG